jgi:hypothetical protein
MDSCAPSNFAVGLLATLICCLFFLPRPSAGQALFSDCNVQTETNATLIFPAGTEILLDKRPLKGPLQIAVFTPQGECSGVTTWTGASTALTAWGHISRGSTPRSQKNALSPDDSLHIRLYSPDTGTIYSSSNADISLSLRSNEPHLEGNPHFVPDGIYVIDSIRVRTSLASREE